jgi:signal transduction histidine kinase
LPLTKVNINLKDLILSIVDRFKSISNKKHIEFIVNLEDIQIKADKEKLTQALSNIISNAIKYSNQNGVVEVSSKKALRHIEIIVKDNGIGIPENDLPFIFDRFYRVDKSRSDGESIGIGLTIAKRIIETHGGKILLESKLNKYTVFKIILPYGQLIV